MITLKAFICLQVVYAHPRVFTSLASHAESQPLCPPDKREKSRSTSIATICQASAQRHEKANHKRHKRYVYQADQKRKHLDSTAEAPAKKYRQVARCVRCIYGEKSQSVAKPPSPRRMTL
jgi:hypothetical protein